MKEKKIPTRMCIACKNMFPKKDLLRIIKDENGISYDPTGKKNGRGAYICASNKCLEKMIKQKIFEKALGSTISEETKKELEIHIMRREANIGL